MAYDIDLTELHTVMNEKSINIFRISSRYIISYGGSASAKSYGAAQKILIRTLSEEKHRFLIARKYATSLKRSSFQLFLDLIQQWNLSKLFRVNYTNMVMTCINGNQLLFVGLDDVEKLKSIAGISGIWIEEASEVRQEDFMQLDLRLRGQTLHYKQIILTFNPTSSQSWLKRRFFDVEDQDATIVHSTYKDNRFIDEHYKQVLENLIDQDENFYRIYALGEWGVLKGRIYTDYMVLDSLPNDYQVRKYGLDFGFNVPMALVEVLEDGNDLYIRELFYQTAATTDDLIQFMKQEGISTRDVIYCDSAEPDRIETLQRAGFKAKPAKKNVRAGIDAVKSKKLFITKDSYNLIKEIENYKWKEDKDGNSLEEPVKFQDHLLDSVRYCAFTDEVGSSKIHIGNKRYSSNELFMGFDKESRLGNTKQNKFKGY